MKNIFLLTASALTCGLLHAQLTYTHVTSGLTSVTFEIGNTVLKTADVDNDGNLDLVSIGDHGSPHINATEGGVMVWKNNGTGTSWSLTKTGSFGYGGVALGDINNDGKMDIACGMHHNYSSGFGSKIIDAALGNGTGNSWVPYDSGLAVNGETYGMFGVDLGDVNNDGLLDIAANSFGCCSGIHVYKNNGNGTWTQTDGANAGNSNMWCRFADLDNDGNVDLLTANELGFIWKNDGQGHFSSMEAGYTGDWWVNFDIADVNNDGAKDIGVIDTGYAARVFYFNKNTNSWKEISNGLPKSNCVGIALADMNMDGFADVVVWNSGSIVIYTGDGAGNWTQAGTITISETSLASLVAGDFDHDGYTDLAYFGSVTSGKNTLHVYLHSVDNPQLNILPVSPKGNECFAPNSVQFLTWQSSVPTNTAATVTIEFSSTGNSGPWSTVASNIPNSGTYQWTAPNVNSPNCFLRYTISNGSSTQTIIMSAAFGIGTCNSATAVNENELSSEISIFPNPSADGKFQIISSASQIGNVEVYNSIGETIFSKTINSKSETVNLAEEASGVYFISVKTQNGIVSKKLSVIK